MTSTPQYGGHSHMTNEVSCAVVGCRYHNTGDTCTAPHISVANENAHSASETSCASFECRDK